MAKRLRFEAIVPKVPIHKASQMKIVARLADIQYAILNRMQDYPSKTSPNYRRTGEYGRRWTKSGPSVKGNDLVAEVGTNLEYAPFVGGFTSQPPLQTRVAQRYGWPSVETVADEEWKKGRDELIDAIQGEPGP